ncbi:MAG TPA: hypothetical protein VNG12_14525 [Acidimicrobiales bacterium]|nr:hypothetical protein [Acidimicrobiales bacterium]
MVDAACDALVAGLDSQGLRELAGVFRSDTEWQVRLLLPEGALEELGLRFFEPGGHAGQVAAIKVMAEYCVAGTMAPRALAAWAHYTFRHGDNPDIERFLVFDDEYDVLEYTRRSEEKLDAEVLDACRHLIDRSDG